MDLSPYMGTKLWVNQHSGRKLSDWSERINPQDYLNTDTCDDTSL